MLMDMGKNCSVKVRLAFAGQTLSEPKMMNSNTSPRSSSK